MWKKLVICESLFWGKGICPQVWPVLVRANYWSCSQSKPFKRKLYAPLKLEHFTCYLPICYHIVLPKEISLLKGTSELHRMLNSRGKGKRRETNEMKIEVIDIRVETEDDLSVLEQTI